MGIFVFVRVGEHHKTYFCGALVGRKLFETNIRKVIIIYVDNLIMQMI